MHDQNFWRAKLRPYFAKSNAIASMQIANTLVPFVALWGAYIFWIEHLKVIFIPVAFLISLFILRSFVLMHDCGHGSLFQSRWANSAIGFVLGVITGMPQFVWSKNHTYHHNTNGDWVKYGGVFNILSTDRYLALSPKKRKLYWLFRQPGILIPAGFVYVVFSPRFNWMMGHISIGSQVARALFRLRFSEAVNALKRWETKYWKGKRDYFHMTANNLVLISIWILMAWLIGAYEFFLLYLVSTSLAGSIGILVFTIQHNFEGSYATDTARVNPYRAALEGTSMLVLPKVLNWFTADIAYHHVHHLSSAIPNYRLKACHKEHQDLFVGVKRYSWRDVFSTFRYQLWDPQLQKISAKPD